MGGERLCHPTGLSVVSKHRVRSCANIGLVVLLGLKRKKPRKSGLFSGRWWRRRELNPTLHLFIGPQKTTIVHKTDTYKNGIPHITTQNRSGVDTLWTHAL